MRAAGANASKYSLGNEAQPGESGQYKVDLGVPVGPIDPMLNSPALGCEEIKYAEARANENYARKRHHGAFN